MYSFENDYLLGAHPQILKRLLETNEELLPGYGEDKYCRSAAEKIKAACACPQAEVYFLTGGTQTNRVIISSMLRDYEGVISASSGHVSVHEAGAIESAGHKVLTLPQHEGKLHAAELKAYLETYHADGNREHMVYPGMVYITHPTEYGTLYSKAELEEISQICRQYQLPLYLDGARLGYGLASPNSDVTLPDVARLCDVFYIGGTKVGALCGEAVLFTKNNTPSHFISRMKQQGALLAKGRLLGVQFDALFTDDLYLKISRHAIHMAQQVKEILRLYGCPFAVESFTNQNFVILENSEMERLGQRIAFSFWEKYDEGHTVVRFATSWSTTQEGVEELRRALLGD